MLRRASASLLATVLAAAICGHAAGSAQGLESQVVENRPLLDNATVEVVWKRLFPGAQDTPRSSPSSTVLVQVTRGTVEWQEGSQRTTGPWQPGRVEIIDGGVEYAARNAGSSPFALVSIGLKPGRTRGVAAPATTPPPGINRTAAGENAEVTAMRIDFSPSAREPVHTHPYDLVVVTLRPALIDVRIGTNAETRGYAAGEVIFVPRDTPHAVANPGPEAFSVVGLMIR